MEKVKVRRYGDDWYAVPPEADEYDAEITVMPGLGNVLIGVAQAYELASDLIRNKVEGVDE